MTTRTHETIRVGLRRVIRDPDVKVKDRLEAIKLLMQVEGLMEAEKANSKRISATSSEPNARALRDLLEDCEPPPRRDSEEDPWQGLPES
jgi:hypothetical protein